MSLIWKIALGIILASILLSLGGLVATAGIAWWANEKLEQELSEQRERQAERDRALAEAKREEAEKQRVAALRERQAREARLAREQEQRNLESEFEAQFVPPEDCVNPQSDTRWVECVDLRRRAKSEYLEQRALVSRPHEDIRLID